MTAPLAISISYDPVRLSGRLERGDVTAPSSAWDRFKARAVSTIGQVNVSDTVIEMPWPEILGILREYGTRQAQESLGFRFAPKGEAAAKIRQFGEEMRLARGARDTLTLRRSREEIVSDLAAKGFTQRALKPFQLRDLERLLSLPHGANFSVPGSGKTTVTFALHLLVRAKGQHFFVVAPKTAFPAWREIATDCMADGDNEPFTVLDGSPEEVDRLLRSGATRFLMTYDLMVRQQGLLSAYFARTPVHLVLDEAHRMKAGIGSQRGAFLLSIASLPVRRDILTGTPMPQSSEDIASQLGFLWPGLGLDLQIQRGQAPRDVLGRRYVRTTKHELGLPPVKRLFYQVKMAPGQMALYGVVRDETLRQLTVAIKGGPSGGDYLGARRSVMRLLQLSANPVLALRAIAGDFVGLNSGIVDEVLGEGPSTKMQAVAEHARRLSIEGKKTVIWTIFTDTIFELERMLADLNPVSIFGAIPAGEESDPLTREWRLRRFHTDPACRILIANPAAAGEGISLHTVCHDAIYLDRSYVTTHYLQSIDRIHRLGLPDDVETNIHIYQTKAPVGVGSIDLSVSRRLATKLRNLQQLLDDPDLHQIALDEENADDPVDYDVELQDLVDLVAELEGRKEADTEEEA